MEVRCDQPIAMTPLSSSILLLFVLRCFSIVNLLSLMVYSYLFGVYVDAIAVVLYFMYFV
jgi:hypothetical protein